MAETTLRVPLATPQEVADYRRVSLGALAQERYKGTGPQFRKLGRKVFYDWDDVYAWVDANTMQRTDDRTGAA